jgi:hypothetical protein
MPSTKLQKFSDFQGQSFFIGIDVHKSSWSVTVRSLNLHLEHFSQTSTWPRFYCIANAGWGPDVVPIGQWNLSDSYSTPATQPKKFEAYP